MPLSKELFEKFDIQVSLTERRQLCNGDISVNPKEKGERFILRPDNDFQEGIIDVCGMTIWALIIDFGVSLKCPFCGMLYRHMITSHYSEDKGMTIYKGVGLQRNKFELPEETRVKLNKLNPLFFQEGQKEITLYVVQYRRCPKCFPPDEGSIPFNLSSPTSTQKVKILLMCLKPKVVLTRNKIAKILQIPYPTALWALEHLAADLQITNKEGEFRYRLKDDSYAKCHREYNVRQIRKAMDKWIGKSRYVKSFIQIV